MSRTGVGCRVMIDGAWLDDGSRQDAEYGDWGQTRRNRATVPVPTAAHFGFSNSAAAYVVTHDPAGGRRDGTGSSKAARTTTTPSRTLASWYGIGATAWNVAGRIPVIEGETITASAYLKSVAATAIEGYLSFSIYNAANALVGTVLNGAFIPMISGEWTRVSITATIPATATNVGIQANTRGQSSGFVSQGTETSWITDVLVESGTVVGSYFDGNFPETDVARYSWESTPDASASLLEEREMSGGNAPPGAPVVPVGVSAISGLSVVWGRETTVDQPQSSACTFQIIDDPGGVRPIDVIRIGQRVDVFADTTIAGDIVTGGAFLDPGFDVEARATTKNATVNRTQERAWDPGGWSAEVQISNPGAVASVQFPPGPIQAPGTNPAAWADIATTNSGETWIVAARVFIPAGMRVILRPVLYTGPYADAAIVDMTTSASATGANAWTDLSVTFYPAAPAYWAGFQIETQGGTTWGTVDPAATWANI